MTISCAYPQYFIFRVSFWSPSNARDGYLICIICLFNYFIFFKEHSTLFQGVKTFTSIITANRYILSFWVISCNKTLRWKKQRLLNISFIIAKGLNAERLGNNYLTSGKVILGISSYIIF